jgi:hypothetical protein
MKNILNATAVVLSLFTLVPASAFAFTAQGKYQVQSAESVLDALGNRVCVSVINFNSFGKVGDIVDVSITNSEVIIVGRDSSEFVDLKKGREVLTPGAGGGDVVITNGQFTPAQDTVSVNDTETNVTQIVSVSAQGNQLEFVVQKSNQSPAKCELIKVGN